MIEFDVVTLSRLQYAVTEFFDFLFVPLSIGLSMMLLIMETAYLISGREIWLRITKFWGLIFAINFASGLATGIAMQLQLGANWSQDAQYLGTGFGAPLATLGHTTFVIEAALVGLFFFGWQRLSKAAHLIVTALVALGASLSALWMQVANGWKQNPVGAHFNYRALRTEPGSFGEALFNPVAQAKFVHTLAAGYTLGAVFVLAVSAWYLLQGRNLEIARRSLAVAASFGLAGSLAAVVLGDVAGYLTSENQQMKIAAIEADWHTQKPPAAFTLFGLPAVGGRETQDALRIPGLLGLIATRSLDSPVEGIDELVERAKLRVISGMDAYAALQVMRQPARDSGDVDSMTSEEARRRFEAHQADLGFGLLLLRLTADPAQASAQQIDAAAWMTVPNVPVLFWAFRVMAAIGLALIGLFATAFYVASRRGIDRHRRFLWAAVQSLPLPWIAAVSGWIVADCGREPWAVDGILPTFLGASPLSAGTAWASLLGAAALYAALASVDVLLIVRTVRRGPDAAGG
jgi:cytochrome d ubiquinol oxidase subunit I